MTGHPPPPSAPPAIVWQLPLPQQSTVMPQQRIESAFPCDDSGVIRCTVTETVIAPLVERDLRVIAKYVSLLSERNRRFYVSFKEKLPSAAYELVRRIHRFPFLPYGDMYAITDMQLIVQDGENRISVRYLKNPDEKKNAELGEDDYIRYSTDLRGFMNVVTKEIDKLKKYEKAPPA